MRQPLPYRRLKLMFCGSSPFEFRFQPREVAAVATDAGNLGVAGGQVAGPAPDGDLVASGFRGAAAQFRLVGGEVVITLAQVEMPHHAA